MKPLIEPVETAQLKQELTPARLLRNTNNGNNEIYVITAAECPAVMREIGRLRELSFRDGGGGTGADVDIDELDLVPAAEGGYQQLLVWDPKAEEIVGGYRFILSRTSHPRGMSTEHYFRFTERFRKEYLPYTIELGRSFVQPHYQGSRANPKGLYSLDNLWDGLGALVVENPDMRYFFGKVTMYGSYDKQARNMLLFFLRKYFPDQENLVEAIHPIQLQIDDQKMEQLFCGGSYAEDYKILTHDIRTCRENIPPLINSYMSLSPSMKVFGTVVNPDFGDVEETGILITIKYIYP
ncbi:MAG: GNAT family N-acetyltransferase, partial [Alistipes sp.]|nr:GNAT family N-acetyltransferase [Alistipes sp.]